MKGASRWWKIAVVVVAGAMNMGAWAIVQPIADTHIGYSEPISGGGTGNQSASYSFNAHSATQLLSAENGTVDSYGNWDKVLNPPDGVWNSTANPIDGYLQLRSGGVAVGERVNIVYDGSPS